MLYSLEMLDPDPQHWLDLKTYGIQKALNILWLKHRERNCMVGMVRCWCICFWLCSLFSVPPSCWRGACTPVVSYIPEDDSHVINVLVSILALFSVFCSSFLLKRCLHSCCQLHTWGWLSCRQKVCRQKVRCSCIYSSPCSLASVPPFCWRGASIPAVSYIPEDDSCVVKR